MIISFLGTKGSLIFFYEKSRIYNFWIMIFSYIRWYFIFMNDIKKIGKEIKEHDIEDI